MASRNYLGIAVMSAALAACTPPHTSRDGNFVLKADPGYAWQDGNSWFNNEVKWKQGLPHPSFPHIRSSATEGRWTPDDGYSLSGAGDLTVKWRPNTPSRLHNYVISGEAPDTWRPDEGFKWTDSANGGLTDFRVTWVPGSRSDRLPNMYAAPQVAHWYPDPGYRIDRRANGTLIAVALPPAPPAPTTYYPQTTPPRPQKYAIRVFGGNVQKFDTEAGCVAGLDYWRRRLADECRGGGLGTLSCLASATCHPVS